MSDTTLPPDVEAVVSDMMGAGIILSRDRVREIALAAFRLGLAAERTGRRLTVTEAYEVVGALTTIGVVRLVESAVLRANGLRVDGE